MFLLNSRHGSFTAPPLRAGDPFFRSYGASVPSSLTRFLSRALVYLHHSTCVGFGTVAGSIPRSFSRRYDADGVGSSEDSPPAARGRAHTGFSSYAALRASTGYSDSPCRPACRMLHRSNSCRQSGNINPVSIDYAFRPRLRIRLTPGGRTCPGKPWNFGGGDSRPTFRYSCPHYRLRTVHGRFPDRFDQCATLPYHTTLKRHIPVFGTVLTPDHFRRRASRLVSYYAMFK